ncbi:ATP synthase F0 subunit B [Luteolibacter pohnpeiensis]|uniref:ATP synthase subunit b n=2 Tax=Luteolibacter pohnpeiensis TaxID=454153 RepID=A0A934S3X3_9BACT|nr:ATP synthase F0 subunit B [Luteolibacter pohnpeiensis]
MFDILAQVSHAPEASDSGVVSGITQTFHVEWVPFISQVVSFLVVAYLLKKFAFTPIQDMLEQRRSRIIEGEEKLKVIEKQLAESEASTAAAIAKANDEALRLITEAKESAAIFSEQKSQEAIASAQQILAKAEAAAQAERAAIKAELKNEFGRLVAATTSQVTGKVLTAEDQSRINEDALAKVEG